MTVPPHPHPYPPPGYPYGPPPPPRMPGLTTTAIVLMWVMVTLSAFGALLTMPVLAVIDGPFGTRVTVLTAITAGQGLIWAGFRAYFAVKIARRSSSARTMAIVVEAVAMACQVVLSVLILDATMTQVSRFPHTSVSFDCTGIVLPILVICFLSTNRSRWWCDR